MNVPRNRVRHMQSTLPMLDCDRAGCCNSLVWSVQRNEVLSCRVLQFAAGCTSCSATRRFLSCANTYTDGLLKVEVALFDRTRRDAQLQVTVKNRIFRVSDESQRFGNVGFLQCLGIRSVPFLRHEKIVKRQYAVHSVVCACPPLFTALLGL